MYLFVFVCIAIVLTKFTATQNELALSYHIFSGIIYFSGDYTCQAHFLGKEKSCDWVRVFR